MDAVSQHMFTKSFTNYSQNFWQSCVICATNDTGRDIHIQQVAHPIPLFPLILFDHLQIYFIEQTPIEGKKFCLVIVDMISKWVEVFPTAK